MPPDNGFLRKAMEGEALGKVYLPFLAFDGAG